MTHNVIFVANHTSELDPLILPAALPFWSKYSPIFFTSREEKFYDASGWRRHFYGGYFFKALGAYPVAVGLQDYEKSLQFQIDSLKMGRNVCIFPEGRISPDGNIQSSKGGVAYLAYVTNIPIVPVRICGAWKLNIFDVIRRKRAIQVIIGNPFFVRCDLSNPSLNDFKIYTNEVMKYISLLKTEEIDSGHGFRTDVK